MIAEVLSVVAPAAFVRLRFLSAFPIMANKQTVSDLERTQNVVRNPSGSAHERKHLTHSFRYIVIMRRSNFSSKAY